MPRPLRSEIYRPQEIAILHCTQRCVRRAYLSGVDTVSGTDYTYRKEWIRQRIEKLASVFGLDILTYAIMSNHLHLVLRSRPDVVNAWSDRQAALRWLQIFPGKRIDEQLGDPTTHDVDTLVNDTERMALVRLRLSDVSWFMRALSEPIARLANRQDKCTGSFWEGRFKAQRLLDEAALLACCMYVDLNPVRAAMEESPADSKFTSAYDRMRAEAGETIESAAAPMQTINREEASQILKNSTPEQLVKRRKNAKERRGMRVARDAWLAPLTLVPRVTGPVVNKEGVRASDKGFLNMSLADYLALLYWTGSQGRADKSGKIAADSGMDYAPVLAKLGIADGMWCDLVWNFKKYFGKSRGPGSPDRMQEEAILGARKFQPGQRKARKCFV
jgi:REP element-mobilizing transposase RayT